MNKLVFRPSSIIGLSEAQAKTMIEKNNYNWRVTKRDGEYFIMNRYVDDSRISLHVEEGTVVDAYVG